MTIDYHWLSLIISLIFVDEWRWIDGSIWIKIWINIAEGTPGTTAATTRDGPRIPPDNSRELHEAIYAKAGERVIMMRHVIFCSPQGPVHIGIYDYRCILFTHNGVKSHLLVMYMYIYVNMCICICLSLSLSLPLPLSFLPGELHGAHRISMRYFPWYGLVFPDISSIFHGINWKTTRIFPHNFRWIIGKPPGFRDFFSCCIFQKPGKCHQCEGPRRDARLARIYVNLLMRWGLDEFPRCRTGINPSWISIL